MIVKQLTYVTGRASAAITCVLIGLSSEWGWWPQSSYLLASLVVLCTWSLMMFRLCLVIYVQLLFLTSRTEHSTECWCHQTAGLVLCAVTHACGFSASRLQCATWSAEPIDDTSEYVLSVVFLTLTMEMVLQCCPWLHLLEVLSQHVALTLSCSKLLLYPTM